MHWGRKRASRVFPGVWETRARALGQLGNKTAWNLVLNCTAQNAKWVAREGEGSWSHKEGTLNNVDFEQNF